MMPTIGSLMTSVLMTYFLTAVPISGKGIGCNYHRFLDDLRHSISHPYQDGTRIMTGSKSIHFVSLSRLVNFETSVELLVSHQDLHILGYRVNHNKKNVYLFSDYGTNSLEDEDFDIVHALGFGSDYGFLEKHYRMSRTQVKVSEAILRDGLQALEHGLNYIEGNGTLHQALFMFTLKMATSEAARFTEIGNAIYRALQNGSTWQPSLRDVGLMDSWAELSTFVAETLPYNTTKITHWFPKLNQTLTPRMAQATLAVIARPVPSRCCGRPSADCDRRAVDAALADDDNGVYLFNGPNVIHLQFIAGSTTEDCSTGAVESIWNLWPSWRGSPFVTGIDAALKVPYDEVDYIFKGAYYFAFRRSREPQSTDELLLETIWKWWFDLRLDPFYQRIDAAFASKRRNQYYLFSGNRYIHLGFSSGTNDYDRILGGPTEITSSWPLLKGTAFENGIDAAFGHPTKSEAFLFKNDEYVLVNYGSISNNDTVKGPFKIRDTWPSLHSTAFDV